MSDQTQPQTIKVDLPHPAPSVEQLLQCVEAVLACREALDMNVKPKFAVDDMVARIGLALARPVGA